MLIPVTKKYLTYYKCKLEEIPPGIYSEEGMKLGLFKAFYMYVEDYKQNKNTKTELVNTNQIKYVTEFDYDEEFKGVHGCEYLIGGKSKITFIDNTSIIVTERVSEISKLTV